MTDYYKQSDSHPTETPAPCREERLARHRDVALRVLMATPAEHLPDMGPNAMRKAICDGVEEWAHAMLAAERPAEAPGGDKIREALTRAVRIYEKEAAESEERGDVSNRNNDAPGAAFERGRAQGLRDVYREIKRILGNGGAADIHRALLPDDKETP